MTQAQMRKVVRAKYPGLTALGCRMMFGEITFYDERQLLALVKRQLENEYGTDDETAQFLYSGMAEHIYCVLTGKMKLRKGERIPKSHNLGID